MIEKVRERAIENLMLHKGFDRAACEHIVDIVFNTEIVPERECEWCDGKGVRQEVDLHCVTCNGTGKLTVTVERAIKQAQEG